MESYIWKVKPAGASVIIRRCARCGHGRFVSSGRFRVNANGCRIDVWLIWRCGQCGATWNMEICARVLAGGLNKELYQRFMENDAALALRYAFDRRVLGRHNAVADAAAILLEVEGAVPQCGDARIVICPEPMLPVSAARVAAHKLGISQSAVQRLEDARMIDCEPGMRRAMLTGEVAFLLREGWEEKIFSKNNV